MKKLKIVGIILLVAVMLAGTFVIGVYAGYLNTLPVISNILKNEVTIHYVNDVDIKLQYSNKLNVLDENGQKLSKVALSPICLYSFSEDNTLVRVELIESVLNFEGYHLNQYVSLYTNEHINQEFYQTIEKKEITNQHDCTIYQMTCEHRKTEEEYDFDEIETYYFVQYHQVFYVFYWNTFSKEVYEQYYQEIDEAIATIQIDDSNLTIPYQAENDTMQEKRFYYSLLSEKEKVIYDEIVATFHLNDEPVIGTKYTHHCKSEEEYEKCYKILRYMVRDYEYMQNLIFVDDVSDDENEVFMCVLEDENSNAQMIKHINDIADKIINDMPSNLTKYGKYQYLAHAICDLAEYDYTIEKENSHNIMGIFIDHTAVCEGYTLAYQYICNRAGLFCATLTGESENPIEFLEGKFASAHIWNVIRLNGEYYYMDTTWMDEGHMGSQEPFNYEQAKNNGHQDYMFDFQILFDDDSPFYNNQKRKYPLLHTGSINWQEEKDLLFNTDSMKY